MADDEGAAITFNSRSKSPYDKLSNFYEGIIRMPEGVFFSVEHYFQAMKFVDGEHPRFEVDGDLGRQDFGGNWKQTVSKARSIKSVGGKTGTKKYKLTLRSDGLDRERNLRIMTQALRKKFESEPFRSLLLETGSRDLVHTPLRGKTNYWTGRVNKESGEIVGENKMGILLMLVREELRLSDDSGFTGGQGNSALIESDKDVEKPAHVSETSETKVGGKDTKAGDDDKNVVIEGKKKREKKREKQLKIEESAGLQNNVEDGKKDKSDKGSESNAAKNVNKTENTSGECGENFEGDAEKRRGKNGNPPKNKAEEMTEVESEENNKEPRDGRRKKRKNTDDEEQKPEMGIPRVKRRRTDGSEG